MAQYVLTRFLQAIVAMFVVVTIVFVLLHATGDPISVLAPETMNAQERAELAHSLGLDLPLSAQYLHFFANIVHGDMGVSFYT
ncbi:MAG: ABC transporter permease, partial [Vulcanimicrobiaceae bacterium]